MSGKLNLKLKLNPLANIEVSTESLTRIDQTDLGNEFASQAARYAYFAALCAEARYNRDVAEAAFKEEEAAAFSFYKNSTDHIPEGSRTVTDGLAKYLVTTDDNVIEAQDEYIEAERQFRLMEALVKSLEQRANMLISLGAQLRSEADMTGMVIREDPIKSMRDAMKKR